MNQLNQFLQSEEDLVEGYEFNAITDRGLQFTFAGIEIEIVVSPPWSKPSDLYTFLETMKPAYRSK